MKLVFLFQNASLQRSPLCLPFLFFLVGGLGSVSVPLISVLVLASTQYNVLNFFL